jgi:glutathione peroxidase
MTTVSRVRGAQAAPVYAFLAERGGGPPRWNFHKYLVARDGRSVRGFATQTGPEAPALVQAIEAALVATPPAA